MSLTKKQHFSEVKEMHSPEHKASSSLQPARSQDADNADNRWKLSSDNPLAASGKLLRRRRRPPSSPLDVRLTARSC